MYVQDCVHSVSDWQMHISPGPDAKSHAYEGKLNSRNALIAYIDNFYNERPESSSEATSESDSSYTGDGGTSETKSAREKAIDRYGTPHCIYKLVVTSDRKR